MFNKIISKIKSHSLSENLQFLDAHFGLGKLELMIAKNWLNPFATFYLNIRSFPLKQAIKFPIFVYGRPRFYGLSGTMKIEGKIKPGMIKFNVTLPGAPSNMSTQSEIFNNGTIIFKGKGEIGTGTKISTSFRATLQIGRNFRIADYCNITCSTQITIGEQNRIAHRCQIIDSNYHFIANFNKKIIPRYSRPISFGKGCWICNSSTITGGTILPDYTIIGSNSLVNKDFSTVPDSSIIGGIPAKLIATGFRKVENSHIVSKVFNYFKSHCDSPYYPISDDDTPEICSFFNRNN